MQAFWEQVVAGHSGAPADAALAEQAARALGEVAGAEVYAESLAAEGGVLFALARRDLEKALLAAWPAGARPRAARGFKGKRRETTLAGRPAVLLEGPRSETNAAALRRSLPWTAPQAVAGRPSIGLGDRLGLATPGHVRAVRGTGLVPMLAQQSIREMTRTQRSPQQVIDDATWGVFQTGFRTGFGADADHLKTAEAIDDCAAAGFTFYTIDPGDHVDDGADAMPEGRLAEAFEALPWDALETTADEVRRRYFGRVLDLGEAGSVALSETVLGRAAVKYARAVAHTAALYRHLVERLGEGRFELEVSVDETESPTTPADHFFIAWELSLAGVRWVSLAPRFVGRFEKGVDYLGDAGELKQALTAHLEIAERFGRYKISLHSGSDKFSVYAMAAEHGRDRVHVKTAGTSYLEALRVLAEREPGLLREIYAFARDRYDIDKATYHVSARMERMPRADAVADADLPALVEQFDARQALHVTFGSVLTWEDGARFKGRMLEALKRHEEAYAEALHRHIGRHVAPFLGGP